MEDDSEPPAVEVRQNLNDLQSYLVHFNKEIGNNDVSSFQQKFISQIISASKSEKSTPSEEDLPSISDDKTPGSESMITDDLSESQISLSEVSGAKYEVMDEMSSVTADIADTISSLVDENHSATEIEGLQGIMNSENIMMIPITNASDILAQGGQKLVQIVNVNGTPTLQVVNTETQLTASDALSPAAQQIKALVESIASVQAPVATTNTITTTPAPVIVLPSTPSDPSILRQIQPVSLPTAGTAVNPSQLMAIRSGTDNTGVNPAQLTSVLSATNTAQPQQLIQAEDGTIYSVTNGSQSVLLPQPVPTVVSNASVVTAPLKPATRQIITHPLSAEEQPADGSYILIVNASGEKEQGKVYDFGGNLRGDVIEEITEPDGTTKRLVKVLQLPGPPANSEYKDKQALPVIPFGDQLMCNYCNYTSPKKYLLSRHMKCHSEDRPHKCNICSRGFKSLASLHNHINVHMGVKPHKCKSCDSEFTTSGELIRHIRYKHTFEKPHKCSECDYASVELSKMKRHIRSHTGERPYQCTQCDYASPDTYKLKRHMRIHTGEKPYECDVCKARFTQSNSLKAHKLIHSGNKPVFQCEFCPTTCGRKTDLKIHIQKLHSADTAQKCKRCGDDFPDRWQYKVHMKTHEGDKCFTCHQCDFSTVSVRQFDMHNHIMHSGVQPYKCEECKMAYKSKRQLTCHRRQYHINELTSEELAEMQNAGDDEEEDEEECAGCLKLYEKYRHHGGSDAASGSQGIEEEEGEELEHTCGTAIKPVSSYTADQLIENGLLADMKDGKLGTSPKVVVVHPDGRIEEVTAKLQSLSQANSKPVDDFLVSLGVTGDTQLDSVTHIISSATEDDLSNPPPSSAIIGDTASKQSNIVANQSTNPSLVKFETVDQSECGLKLEDQSTIEDQSGVEGDQSSETEPEFLVHAVDNGTNQLIINFDLKEASTQATIDPEDPADKVTVTQAQPQLVTAIQVTDKAKMSCSHNSITANGARKEVQHWRTESDIEWKDVTDRDILEKENINKLLPYIESDLQPDQHTIILARRNDSMVDSQQEHPDRPTIVMSSDSGQNVKPAYVSLLQKQNISQTEDEARESAKRLKLSEKS